MESLPPVVDPRALDNVPLLFSVRLQDLDDRTLWECDSILRNLHRVQLLTTGVIFSLKSVATLRMKILEAFPSALSSVFQIM